MREIKYRRNSFREIVERIKDIISNEIDGKVYDRHVADVLKISNSTLRIYKIKNIVPLENIAYFCEKFNISFDWLVYDKSFKIRKLREDVYKNKHF